tara:strand:+ start:70 stop:564 length:495 start_codon:yes stop_codon:yes gene_type:complete
MSFDGEITIDFEDPKLNKIVEENLTESTKEKKAMDMVDAIEEQLDKFETSEEGLANANLLLKMYTKWYGENADIIEDGDWLFAEKEKKTWQTKLEETIRKISVKIAEITMKLDELKNRENYDALRGGKRTRRRKRRKRRKRKTRKRKRKKSRKKRKRRRRRTRK